MAASRLERVVQTLRQVVSPREEADLTDGQLLETYVRTREEAAFAALVRRHGPMVWGVCWRTLDSHHDVEDAFQATFLVLVRKAASLREREKVANWLYGVALQTARKARATSLRRRTREKQVNVMPEPAAEQGPRGDELHALLDQELSRLPEKYRLVLVLCDLEGKTRKEAARQCRIPEGTVASRLATARAMLARRLTRHGQAVSGGALAAVLAEQAALASVPGSVAASTIQAASLFEAGRAAAPGILSVRAVALAEGVLKTMLLTKLKMATAVLLLVAGLGTATAALLRAVPPARAVEPALATPESAGQPPAAIKESERGNNVVSGVLKAVDADKGTLTIAHRDGDRTFSVARDAVLVNNGRPATLFELPARAFVTLGLADERTARTVEAVGPNVGGILKAVDAARNAVTLDERDSERTFTVTRNGSVTIDGRPGKLADLPPGSCVTLGWFVDPKTVRSVQADGRSYYGARVKAVDAEKHTITFDEERSPAELAGKTFTVARDALVEIDGKSGGKLTAIPKGAVVHPGFQSDQKTVRQLTVEGRNFPGALVKAVDADRSTLTFDAERAPPELAGKTLSVAKEASIQVDGKPGKLTGVPAGAILNVTLSVDQQAVRILQAEGPQFPGALVKAVDTPKGSITFDTERTPEVLAGKTFPVAPDAGVLIDGRPAPLAGVPPGANVQVLLSVDQKTIRHLSAEGRGFPVVLVKAADAVRNTITFDQNRSPEDLAGKTFPVARDANIAIDGRSGALAGIPPGAVVSVGLSVDQKTVRTLSADGPQIGNPGGAVVDSVDVEKGTITVDVNGEGLKSFPVARDAVVTIDGKPGKLAGVVKEAAVVLTLRVDQKTVGRIEAKSP